MQRLLPPPRKSLRAQPRPRTKSKKSDRSADAGVAERLGPVKDAAEAEGAERQQEAGPARAQIPMKMGHRTKLHLPASLTKAFRRMIHTRTSRATTDAGTGRKTGRLPSETKRLSS